MLLASSPCRIGLAEVERDHLGGQVVEVEALDRPRSPSSVRRTARPAPCAPAAAAARSSSRRLRSLRRRVPSRSVPDACVRSSALLRCWASKAGGRLALRLESVDVRPLRSSRWRGRAAVLVVHAAAARIALAAVRARGVVVLDHLHEQVLAPIEVGRDQRLAVRDQVADPHAGLVRVAQRLRDVALQGDRIGELRRDLEQRQDVAVAQRLLQAAARRG